MIRYETTDQSFKLELKNLVDQKIKENGSETFKKFFLVSKVSILSATALLFYLGVILTDIHPLLKLILSMVYGMSVLFLALNISHDAVHQTATSNEKANKTIHFMIFSLLGVDPYLWSLRHIKSHHMYPNVNGVDVDIEDNAFVRLSPHHTWRPHQKFQHLYAWFLYGFTLISITFFQDFLRYKTKKMANIETIKYNKLEKVLFFLSKAIFFSVCFILPYSLTDLSMFQVALGFFISSFVVSLLFILLLAGTHFFNEADFSAPNEKQMPHSYVHHQLANSLDWNINAKWLTYLVGGINTHAAHHLFPKVSHMYYHMITPIIMEMTEKYKMPYHQTTFWGMIRSHYQLLKRLGQNNSK